jgi:hypothetical protein
MSLPSSWFACSIFLSVSFIYFSSYIFILCWDYSAIKDWQTLLGV